MQKCGYSIKGIGYRLQSKLRKQTDKGINNKSTMKDTKNKGCRVEDYWIERSGKAVTYKESPLNLNVLPCRTPHSGFFFSDLTSSRLDTGPIRPTRSLELECISGNKSGEIGSNE